MHYLIFGIMVAFIKLDPKEPIYYTITYRQLPIQNHLNKFPVPFQLKLLNITYKY